MKKRKVGEINVDADTKAEFYLSDVTLVYSNKEPRVINYVDIYFLQEMFVEEKAKYLLGMYLRDPTSTKTPSLTFADFNRPKEFLECFYSVKNCIPNFEGEMIKGFYGNLRATKQKPKKCELGLDHKNVLLKSTEDDQPHFFRVEVNDCKVEELPDQNQNMNMIKISLMQSQLSIVNFTKKEDVFAFKNLMYQAIEEGSKDHAVMYDDIEDIDKFKIYILENSPYLKNLHEKLVISGAMTEQEFWESRSEYQEYKKYYIENRQKLGKTTGLLIKDKITSEAEKQRILTQFPEVKAAYFNEVMDGDNFNYDKDKKFWEEFMKLQKKKDTEIVGGKNHVVVPLSQPNLYQHGDITRKIDISEIPLGEVDLCRNLDVKTNVAEKLMYDTLKQHYGDYGMGKHNVEETIKRFQTHGLNVLGGIKPSSNIQGFTIQELVDEFKDLMPEHLEIPEDMQIKTVKTSHADPEAAHKGTSDDKMLIELISSQKVDGKNSKANAEAITSKLQKLLENKSELKERRKNIFNRSDMQNVFRELVQASLQKEETIEYSQYREKYENYYEEAKDLLRLFYSIGSSDDANAENKRRTMKNLMNELIGKINIYLGDLNTELKRQTGQRSEDRMKEGNKLTKVMETVLEQLKFAVALKE